MRISTKGRYGVRSLFELAMHYGRKPLSLKAIAENQGLSEHYLEQLMAPLRQAGLVESVRGAQGGYILAKDPAQITVGDIIRILEGPIGPTECVYQEEERIHHCGRADICVTRGVWERVRDSIASVLDSITLQNLCEEARMKEINGKKVYYF